MPKAPTWQMSFNANLDQPISSDLRLVATAVLSHSSKTLMMNSVINGVLPDVVAPSYWLGNGRIGLKTTDDVYGVALVADNIFNTSYYTSGNSTGMGNVLAWGNPRIIRAELTMKF